MLEALIFLLRPVLLLIGLLQELPLAPYLHRRLGGLRQQRLLVRVSSSEYLFYEMLRIDSPEQNDAEQKSYIADEEKKAHGNLA